MLGMFYVAKSDACRTGAMKAYLLSVCSSVLPCDSGMVRMCSIEEPSLPSAAAHWSSMAARSQCWRGCVLRNAYGQCGDLPMGVEIRPVLTVALGAVLSERSRCCSAGVGDGDYKRHPQACEFSRQHQCVQRVCACFALACLSTRSIGFAGCVARRRVF